MKRYELRNKILLINIELSDFRVRHSEHLQEVKKEKNGNKEKERISSSNRLWKTKNMQNKPEPQNKKPLQHKAHSKITTNKPVSKNEPTIAISCVLAIVFGVLLIIN